MIKSNHLIWIRHGEKLHDNGKLSKGCYSMKHDSPLKPDAEFEIRKKTIELYTTYGFPNQIICSPFLRTRETRDIILNSLREINPEKVDDIILTVDNNIGEFLGFQRPIGEIAQVEEETQKYYKQIITLGEPLNNLRDRVRTHVNELLFPSKKEKCIWVITHGIVISSIYNLLTKKYKFTSKKLPENMPYLFHLCLNKFGDKNVLEFEIFD